MGTKPKAVERGFVCIISLSAFVVLLGWRVSGITRPGNVMAC